MCIITRIDQVKSVGVFRNFAWPVKLSEFQHFNLIYGVNGSGKTTLSNILRCLELKTCEKGTFSIAAGVSVIKSSAIKEHASLPQVRVFNRDFVSDNVFTATGTCCPIFYLGAESASKQKQIEEMRVRNREQEEARVVMQQKFQSLNKTLDDLRIDVAKTIRELLRSSGSGNAFNTYDKRNFSAKCDAFRKSGVRPRSLSDDEKTLKKAAAADSAKAEIAEVRFEESDLSQLSTVIDSVLSRNVVSKVIFALKSSPSINAWAEQGLRLHREMIDPVCQFCGGLVSADRIRVLENHFSDEYSTLTKDIENARCLVVSEITAVKRIVLADEARFYGDAVDRYRSAVADVRTKQEALLTFLEALNAALDRKQKNPFDAFQLAAVAPSPLKMDLVNGLVREHNARTRNFQVDIAKARADVEEAIIADSFERIVQLEDDVDGVEGLLNELKVDLNKATQELARREAELKEHHHPAEQINCDLASFLGRKDIALIVEDAGYRVVRDGVVADGLSEGEKTALAIVYFLKSLDDRGFDKRNGVVVIDDPVSSLDAGSLFCAFGFIQERTKDVGQLFILTHNFSFLRLVRKWLFRINLTKKKTKRESRMYMLRCLGASGGREADLVAMDPLLSEYESEYSYLFAQVVSGASESSGEIERFYHYPNMARRLLEAFLAFRLPGSAHTWEYDKFKSDMHGYLKELGFDAPRTNRILNFLPPQQNLWVTSGSGKRPIV